MRRVYRAGVGAGISADGLGGGAGGVVYGSAGDGALGRAGHRGSPGGPAYSRVVSEGTGTGLGGGAGGHRLHGRGEHFADDRGGRSLAGDSGAADVGRYGGLPATARFTLFHPGPGEAEGVCKLALHPDDFSPERAAAFVERVLQILVKEIPALAAARVIEQSPRALPRDGHHLRGRYILSESDILTPRHHGLDAVRGWWPIEQWDLADGPVYAYPPPGEAYEIPYEAGCGGAAGGASWSAPCLTALFGQVFHDFRI